MIVPRLFLLQAVCLCLLQFTFADRQLLQKGNANNATEPTVTASTTATTATGALSCGELDPKSVAPPENAVLYLSLRGPGVITYKCVEANKPVVLEESADLTETISKGWSGKVETKDGARVITTTNGNEKPPATNVFVLAADPTSANRLNGAPDLRWEVSSNTGASAAEGGIPSGVNYVTRTQAEGGAPPRSCDAGETIKVQFSAAYNIYSCDEAYLVKPPAPGPAATVPAAAPSVTVAPVPAQTASVPAPTATVPAPTPEIAPVAIPPVAVAPAPTPDPVVPVTVAPAMAPVSSASMFTAGVAVAAAVGSCLL